MLNIKVDGGTIKDIYIYNANMLNMSRFYIALHSHVIIFF